MAGSIPSAHDSILRFVDADGAERAVVIDSPEWHVWLADSGHSRFAFTCRAGSFTARKERKQRGAWYWVAYRRAQGKIHKAYLGKPADLTLARLQSVAALLAERSAPRDDAPARDAGIQPQAANTVWPGGTATLLLTKLYVPPIRPNLVARRRLVEHLHAGARGRLTLLSAPAGFGKTTLLAEWIATQDEGGRMKDEAGGRSVHPSSFILHPFKVAWVSLDEGDADPVRFWSYVVAALDRLFPGLGAGALAALQSPQPPPIEAVLTPLLNALAALPGDVALILDDYHVIGTHAIHQALTFLIEHLPPQLHLVIATRSDPPLPLTRLRARGELVEVRTTDLRFSAVEAAAFLQEAMGLPLSAADVAALETRTEGWIAGLQLAALAMRDRTDLAGFITAFTGSNRFVMDYLAAEVIERLPPQLQTFVLQTSILDRLCGPLCDAILKDEDGRMKDEGFILHPSSFILEQLERANLFIVPLDDERTWYRYHHLFVDVARGRLRASLDAGAVAALHRRASAWYGQQSIGVERPYIAEAVQHALAAQDWERAAHLIEDGGFRGIVRGQLQTVRAWLNTLPDTLVRERAWLCILSAVTLLFTNDLTGAEARLQDAEHCIQPAAPADQAGAMLGHVATIRGAIVHFSGDLARSVALAERALDLLPAAESLSRPLALVIAAHAYRVSGDVTPAAERAALAIAEPVRASGNLLAYLGAFLNLAELRVVQGRLREAAASYREAAEVALGSGGLHVMVGSPAYYFGMADLLREWNDLDAAERHLAQGMELLRGALTVHADVAALGAIVQARLQHARGDGTSALATLETFADLARRRGFDELVIARGAAAQAQLALAQDDLAAALRWAHGYAESRIQAERSSVAVGESSLDSRRSALDFSPVYPHELEDLVLARVWIAQGRDAPERRQIQEALELLDRLLRAAESGGRTGAVVEIQILQALAHQAHGDLRSALAAIERALKLAAPAGYVRLFVDEGAPMAALLRDAGRRSQVAGYVQRLLKAFPSSELRAMSVEFISEATSTQNSKLKTQNLLVEPPTERELAVLRLIAEGLSNREIADRLVIAVGTVKRHVNNLFGKLGVQSRTQAIRVAQDHGLL